MGAKKRGAPAPRPRSGWVTESQRKTERLTLRLDPNSMAILRGYSTELGWDMNKIVAEALRAFDREVCREDGGVGMVNESEEP